MKKNLFNLLIKQINNSKINLIIKIVYKNNMDFIK